MPTRARPLVEVEQQIGQRGTLSVGYQYLRDVDLLMSINQNVPSCVASGTNNGCRPIADYANNSQYTAWDEVIDGVRRAGVVDATSSGHAGLVFGTPRWLAETTSSYPMLAVTRSALVTVWTDGTGVGSAIAVRRGN
jgi:hypothetical protein